MYRLPALLAVALLLAGCHSSTPAIDPFLGRTTVPPPATGEIPPGTAQPYYQGSPPPGAPPITLPPPAGAAPYQFPTTPSGFPQSSLDRPKAVRPGANEYRAGESAIARRSPVQRRRGRLQPDDDVVVVSATEDRDEEERVVQAVAATDDPSRSSDVQQAVRIEEVSERESTIVTSASTPDRVPAGWDVESRDVLAITNNVSVAQAFPGTPNALAARAPRGLGRPAQPTIDPKRQTLNAAERASAPLAVAQAPLSAASRAPQRFVAPKNAVEITDLPRPRTRGGRVQVSSAPNRASARQPIPKSVTTRSGGARYGHHAQYDWLEGKLEYSRSKQEWKLRYIPIDAETDQYGGSVVISNSTTLDGFQPGDFVAVQGSMDETKGRLGSFAPLYTVRRTKPMLNR